MTIETETVDMDEEMEPKVVWTEKRHLKFVRVMEAIGAKTYAYSGRCMFGRQCPAVNAGCNREVDEGDVLAAAKKARLHLSSDSMGLGRVFYLP